MSYGVEIWGWREREKIERLEERYLRWVLGVDGRTPGYMVREELQREKLRGRAGRRAWSFEKRLEEGKGSELARECLEEMKGRWRKGKVREGWEEERQGFFRDRGMEVEEIERDRERMGEIGMEECEERDKARQRKERWERIGESKYNRWYKEIKGEGIPEYLKKGWGESRWGRIARFRMGGEMRESRYWEKGEEKICKLCGNKEETWEHVWEVCRDWREEGGSWQDEVGRILGEEGEREMWMRKLEEERERCKRGGVLEGEKSE
jgi:hypothetical protein